MKVALVTQWQEIEGAYEYARNLIKYVMAANPDIEIVPFKAPFNLRNLLSDVLYFDVVHMNFCFGPHAPLTNPWNLHLFDNRRVVLTFHENDPGGNRAKYPFLQEAKVVVVHQKNDEGFVFVPHGIPVVEPCKWSLENRAIGTAGFPFWQKRYPAIAQAASILSQNGNRVHGLRMIATVSGHADTMSMKQQIEQIYPQAEYITDWWEQDKVLDFLSQNLVNVFVCDSNRLGPSGSVRLGLATGSHIVCSRSLMHRDLFEYEDEIEFVDEPVTGERIAEAVLRVVENGKRPKRVLEDQSWKHCAEIYSSVYRSIAR